MKGGARRHVVLVGLPGSGKSTVGPLIAAELRAAFTDLDRVIEATARRSIPQIFAEDGEAAFREREREAILDLLAGEPGVVAPGAGVFEDAGLRREVLACAWVVYLETDPSEAVRRLENATDRPLLVGDDMERRMRDLLARREAAYLEAQGRVATDTRGPKDVAREVAALARTHAGW